MRKRMLKCSVYSLISGMLIFVACQNLPDYIPEYNSGNGNCNVTKFCVMSDLHYFSPQLLLNDGTAFQTYLSQDRKLLIESGAILTAAINMIKAEKPKFVLIPGDLTKDGEKVGHLEVVNYLKLLKQANIKVFVCPGNHDINNPDAKSFDGDMATPVTTITPDEFKQLYAEFGYNDAIYADPNSLSYVAEPVKGTWILSVDACLYRSNTNTPIVSGKFNDATLLWIKDRLLEAKKKNIRVLGMMHHGIAEHFIGEKALFSEYVIDDWNTVSTQLANLGLNFVFTGHFHAQDIVKAPGGKDYMFDIETGSLSSYPCPVRVVQMLPNQSMAIYTKKVKSINFNIGEAENFQEYAYDFLSYGMDIAIPNLLMSPPYSLPEIQAQALTPAVKEAMMAHYAGDEKPPSPQTQATIDMLLQGDEASQMLGGALINIFTDPAPADNGLMVNMNNGFVVQ